MCAARSSPLYQRGLCGRRTGHCRHCWAGPVPPMSRSVTPDPHVSSVARPFSPKSLHDRDVLSWYHEAGLDEAFLRNLIDVRRIIEPAAARRAARDATAADIAALEAWYRCLFNDTDTTET